MEHKCIVTLEYGEKYAVNVSITEETDYKEFEQEVKVQLNNISCDLDLYKEQEIHKFKVIAHSGFDGWNPCKCNSLHSLRDLAFQVFNLKWVEYIDQVKIFECSDDMEEDINKWLYFHPYCRIESIKYQVDQEFPSAMVTYKISPDDYNYNLKRKQEMEDEED